MCKHICEKYVFEQEKYKQTDLLNVAEIVSLPNINIVPFY